MMLTAKFNRCLSFYPEHMFIPTPLGQVFRPESRLAVVYQYWQHDVTVSASFFLQLDYCWYNNNNNNNFTLQSNLLLYT